MAESSVSLAQLLYDPRLDTSTCLELVQGMEDWDRVSVSHPEGSGIVGEEALAMLSDHVVIGDGSVRAGFGCLSVWVFGAAHLYLLAYSLLTAQCGASPSSPPCCDACPPCPK